MAERFRIVWGDEFKWSVEPETGHSFDKAFVSYPSRADALAHVIANLDGTLAMARDARKWAKKELRRETRIRSALVSGSREDGDG